MTPEALRIYLRSRDPLDTTVDPQIFADQNAHETHHSFVGDGGGGLGTPETQFGRAASPDLLYVLWRRRCLTRSAATTIEGQARAFVRVTGASKQDARTIWAEVRDGKAEDLTLATFTVAYASLWSETLAVENRLKKHAQAHPLWAWAQPIRGIGELMLIGIVAECGRPVSDYRSPAALWSRFCLGVEHGKRQELHASHARRALALGSLGDCQIRLNGPYRPLYDARKLYELERAPEMRPIHAHNRARRYMVKRMLADMWREAKRVGA